MWQDSQAEFNLTSASVMMLDHVMGRPQDEQPPDNPDTDASKRQAGKDSRKMLKSAINELIDTEKSYLYKLRHLHREFAQRLRAYHETDGTIVILTTDQIQKVFSNIDDIVKLHTQVYRDIKVLKAKDRLVEGLPDLLTTLAVNVASIYTQYAIDFACNQRIVVDLVASIPAFAQFVSVSERCCSTRGVRLDSLRIEPIQRVSRYILLVDAIRRYSDKAQQVKLEEVVQQFRDSAEHVDANMKVAQAKRRVVEIQEEFLENLPNPSLVTNGRYCVRESNLQMLSHKKGWTGAVRHVHRMYSFVLFNDILIFATIISENPRRGRLKGRLDLLHTAVDDNISDENDTSFVISSTSDPSKPSLFILAKTPQQKKEWVDDLQICIRQKAEAHGLLPPGASEDSLNSGDYKRAFRPFSQATVPLTRPMPLATNQEQVAVDQAVADGTLQIELAKKLTRKASSRIQ
ncbi:DH domain-containing protein [Plasmodiophora brassicae]|uniref:DH domain-containing protein n=1 Tax=Plasmodiophora brassicae TaxID=37360 RepID=A0A0G4ILE3_PLABS|nr:hypothetical protein PBRA_004674 [Plasmodiophora brassicae]